MTRTLRKPAPSVQTGIAAVEFALLLPLLLMLLVFVLYFGRVFWIYAAMQKGAQNAARYLSSVPVTVIRNPTNIEAAKTLTELIARQHLAEINPGPYPPSFTVFCDGLQCNGYTVPNTIRVGLVTPVEDLIFPGVSGMTIILTTSVDLSYVGK
jgi:hypothetical protein